MLLEPFWVWEALMRPRSGRRLKLFSGDRRMQVEAHLGGIFAHGGASEAELKFDGKQHFSFVWPLSASKMANPREKFE